MIAPHPVYGAASGIKDEPFFQCRFGNGVFRFYLRLKGRLCFLIPDEFDADQHQCGLAGGEPAEPGAGLGMGDVDDVRDRVTDEDVYNASKAI